MKNRANRSTELANRNASTTTSYTAVNQMENV